MAFGTSLGQRKSICSFKKLVPVKIPFSEKIVHHFKSFDIGVLFMGSDIELAVVDPTVSDKFLDISK